MTNDSAAMTSEVIAASLGDCLSGERLGVSPPCDLHSPGSTIEMLQSQSIAHAVFRRPLMYTVHGTLAEVFAFLEGYYSGICTAGEDGRERSGRYWTAFLEYLVATENVGCKSKWHEIVSHLEGNGGTPEDVMSVVLGRYEKYLCETKLIKAE